MTAVRQILPPEAGKTEGRARSFQRFEDFSSYTLGEHYTGADYDPVLDAYPLFEIEVRKK